MDIILGSQSPRRKEILGYFSLPFKQISPSFDEEAVPFTGDPQEYVRVIARGKAASLAHKFPEALIITADTTVFGNGKVYGKQGSEEEAFRSLSELAGEWHTVYTGVAVQKGERVFDEVEATRVLFNALTTDQIRRYLEHTEWRDKAAGYAIQMSGGLIVRKIDGCYYNVMGLPLNALEHLLKRFGLELWDYL